MLPCVMRLLRAAYEICASGMNEGRKTKVVPHILYQITTVTSRANIEETLKAAAESASKVRNEVELPNGFHLQSVKSSW